MIQQLSKEEIEFCELLYNPIAMAECLFSDIDNMCEFTDETKWEVRIGQIPLFSYEYMLAENPKLNRKENFKLKEGAGNIWCFGGRKFGKSVFVEEVDIILSMLLNDGDNVGFSSYDFTHIKGILELIIKVIELHPIVNSFKQKINRSPSYFILCKNGYQLESINMNVASSDPGKAWFQKHFTRIYIEEASGEVQEAYEKRLDAVAEIGCIFRIAGMTNFTKYSPAGKAFYDLALKPWICNLPQYLTPTWGLDEKEKAIKKHGGENSIGYRVFVKGEVTEEGINVFDMQRIRMDCYDTNKNIKHFEVNKENYSSFHHDIVIEKPSNSSSVYMCADIGESAPTEITIFFQINNKFKYEYNITFYGLTDKEQYRVLKWITEKVEANYVALDCGDGSIDKDEFLLCMIDNKINYCRAKDLESFFEKNKNIKVPTFNSNKLEWKEGKIFKHWYNGEMLELKLSPSSGSIKVTPNHSMMIYTKDGLVQKRADEVIEGDWVISPKLDNTNKEYSVLSYLDLKKNKFSKDNYKQIKLDEELAYLLGWCAAEGCSQGKSAYQLTLGNELIEAEYLLKLQQKLFNLDGGRIQVVDRTNEPPRKFKKGFIKSFHPCYNVHFAGGEGFAEFIHNLIGRGAKNKRVPIEIINSPKTVQQEFLRGLLDGDGSIRERQSTEYCLKVISDELVYGVSLLLRQFDIFPTFNTGNEGYNDYFTISWTSNQLIGRWKGIPRRLIGLNSKSNKKILSNSTLIREKVAVEKIEKFSSLLNSDFYFRKIDKIIKYNYDDYVYDLMVEDNNTFCAGNENIIVHNTGRSIYRSFEEARIPSIILVWYQGAKKIAVDFAKDENDNVILKDGRPTYREEFMAEWSVLHLKELFYSASFILPLDYKLDEQLNSVIAMQSGTKVVYQCVANEDHLFDSFKTFSIAHWYNSMNINKSKSVKEFSKVGV